MHWDDKNPAIRAFGSMLWRGVLLDGGRRYPKIPGIMLEKLSPESREALRDLRAQDINDVREEDIRLWTYDDAMQQVEKLKADFRVRMKNEILPIHSS